MVHLTSATLLSIAVLAIGSVASPERRADKVITLDDIKNASPVVPTVTDPSKEALSGGGSNSTFLDARPDLANKVDQAAKTLPSLLADDSTPNPKMVRRTLEKRAKVRHFSLLIMQTDEFLSLTTRQETCEIFTNPKDPGVQATSAALALAAQKACEDWFPGPVLYAVYVSPCSSLLLLLATIIISILTIHQSRR